jgi:hypothetical protein
VSNIERVLAAMPSPLAFTTMLGIPMPRGARADRLRICCPWHNEKNPSCDVTTRAGRIVAHCHSCHEGGDGFSLAAAVWGMSTTTDFYGVLKRVADLLNVQLEEVSRESPRPRDYVRELMVVIDSLTDQYIAKGELGASAAHGLAILKAADPEQREEACRRLDALYDAEREARAKANIETTDLDRERDDALDAMADDVLQAAHRRELVALKRMRLVPELAAIEAEARTLAGPDAA